MKVTKKYSILQKLLLIQGMNAPFYYYFHTTINRNYKNMKFHLVHKYLVDDGKKVYDEPVPTKSIQINDDDIL